MCVFENRIQRIVKPAIANYADTKIPCTLEFFEPIVHFAVTDYNKVLVIIGHCEMFVKPIYLLRCTTGYSEHFLWASDARHKRFLLYRKEDIIKNIEI